MRCDAVSLALGDKSSTVLRNVEKKASIQHHIAEDVKLRQNNVVLSNGQRGRPFPVLYTVCSSVSGTWANKMYSTHKNSPYICSRLWLAAACFGQHSSNVR